MRKVTGVVWSTPEFVPLSVRYFLLWQIRRQAKPSKTDATGKLWDDWLDRPSTA